MNIDIRKYILNNFKGSNKEEIIDTINQAINSKDEEILPGLGVLFELLWNNDFNDQIVNVIYEKTK